MTHKVWLIEKEPGGEFTSGAAAHARHPLPAVPLTTGENRGHHGKILAHAASIAEKASQSPFSAKSHLRRQTLKLHLPV